MSDVKYLGYTFYFAVPDVTDGRNLEKSDVLITFPITPGELGIKVGSKNETVTLIDDGDINILKSPSLAEITFTARFPMRQYPYARTYQDFKDAYFDVFAKLKAEKTSFRFIVTRNEYLNLRNGKLEQGSRTWDTNMLVSLEDFNLKESTDEGDDVLIDITLKQFKNYGVKILSSDTYGITRPRPATNSASANSSTSTYTVKANDCLYNIAKAAYGDGSKWTIIYEANKNTIEEAAKKHGKKSSSNGHWIYPGTVLIIPGVNGANLTVEKLKGSSTKPKTQNMDVQTKTARTVYANRKNAMDVRNQIAGKTPTKPLGGYNAQITTIK